MPTRRHWNAKWKEATRMIVVMMMSVRQPYCRRRPQYHRHAVHPIVAVRVNVGNSTATVQNVVLPIDGLASHRDDPLHANLLGKAREGPPMACHYQPNNIFRMTCWGALVIFKSERRKRIQTTTATAVVEQGTTTATTTMRGVKHTRLSWTVKMNAVLCRGEEPMEEQEEF